jgi:magnesium transporter
VQACRERTHLPKVHAYADHLFIALQVPETEENGQMNLLEVDQFVGRRYLVSVHEPLEDGRTVLLGRDTQAVLHRMEARRYHPNFPIELSYTIVTALARRMEDLISKLASRVAQAEQHIMKGQIGNPEKILEEMFHLRHDLLTVRTIAARSREGYARIGTLAPRFIPQEERPFVQDLTDQFDRVRSLCEGEQQFLQGVIDFYQSRTITKLNIAMERLALISVLLLPVTAIASIYGMNIIVNEHTQFLHLLTVLVVILFIMALMFRWAKRQGWW